MRSAGSHLNADTWRDCIIFLTSSLLGMEEGRGVVHSLANCTFTHNRQQTVGRKKDERSIFDDFSNQPKFGLHG